MHSNSSKIKFSCKTCNPNTHKIRWKPKDWKQGINEKKKVHKITNIKVGNRCRDYNYNMQLITIRFGIASSTILKIF
jgi:hypothetical protein